MIPFSDEEGCAVDDNAASVRRPFVAVAPASAALRYPLNLSLLGSRCDRI
jgi:hypothetical protein